MKASIYLALCVSLLAACGSKNSSQSVGGANEFVPGNITDTQLAVVEAGIREMINGPLPSSLRGVRGMTFPGKPGFHVCGTFSDIGVEYPFYIELGEKDGAPTAIRGQIGNDPGRKAKVTFMCRHHG